MNKHINPIFLRQMRLRVKTPRFAITLAFFNLILLIITLFSFEINFNVNYNDSIDYSASADIFNLMICIEMLMIIFIIPTLSAVSISAERERKTLDLLLSTGIKTYKIIIGKVLENLIVILFYIFSSLPILSMVFTIGGVSVGYMGKFLIEAIVTGIFLGCIGICISTFSKKTIASIVLTFVAVAILCVFSLGIVVGVNLMNNFFGNGESSWLVHLVSYILMLNPVFDITMVAESRSGIFLYVDKILSVADYPEFVTKNWFMLSGIVRLVFSAALIYISSHKLKPVKKSYYYKKEKS